MRGIVNQVLMLCVLTVLAAGCKSPFEKVRESGDPDKILAAGNKYYEEEDYLKANTLYELILANFRGKKEGEELFYRYANTQYNLGNYLTAAYYFERFSATYANSDKREESDFAIAESYHKMSPSFRLDQQYTDKAMESYQRFVNFHPQSNRVEECNKIIDELRRKMEKKAFDSAELYYKMSNYKAALHSFESLLKDYPETPDAEKIRYLVTKAAYSLAVDSYYEKKKERFEKVLDYHAAFIKRYPSSSYKSELDMLLTKSKAELKKLNDV